MKTHPLPLQATSVGAAATMIITITTIPTIMTLSSVVNMSSAFQSSLLAPSRPRLNRQVLDPLKRRRNDDRIQKHHVMTYKHKLSALSTTASHADDAGNEESEDNFIYTTLDDEIIIDSSTVPTSRDLQHVLHTIERAAYTASKIALATSGQIAVQSTKANLRDLVTESDVRCQQVIKEILLEEFPRDLFLGEEDVDLSGGIEGAGDSSVSSSAALKAVLFGGASSSSSSASSSSSNSNEDVPEQEDEDRLVFIVDPIDGTTNFQAGLPIYAMSIGVVALPSSSSSSPEVVAGVIYNPTLGEMTSAVRGRGCYLNNRRIQPPQSSQQQQQHLPPRKSILNQSLINVGFPISKESTLLASSKAVTALATKVRGLRMVACASQAMAWVAQSKLSAYFSWDLNGWDVAAGIVIVEESGGLVSKMVVDDEDGSGSSSSSRAGVETRDMIITCPCERRGEEGLLRDELIEVLKENDCLEY